MYHEGGGRGADDPQLPQIHAHSIDYLVSTLTCGPFAGCIACLIHHTVTHPCTLSRALLLIGVGGEGTSLQRYLLTASSKGLRALIVNSDTLTEDTQ